MRESKKNAKRSTSKKATDQSGLSSKTRLLLIETDREQAKVFGRWLEDEGLSVVSAFDLEEVQDKIQTDSFFMIVLDIDFPEGAKQGLKLCSKLKEDREAKDVPLIVMTYRASLPTIIESLDAGADNFILKPFETHYFLERIELIVAEIEARTKTRRVIDLALLRFILTLKQTDDKENLLRLLFKVFNRTVWAKCVGIMRLDCAALMLNQAKRMVGQKYGFMDYVDRDEQEIMIRDPSEAARASSVETIIEGFERFLNNFLRILSALTGNVIVGLDEEVNRNKITSNVPKKKREQESVVTRK